MVNKVILVGTLVRDAESVVGARGPVTRMRLRTSRSWRDTDGTVRESTEYHNVIAFDRYAEQCSLYGLKDIRLYVEGHLRSRDYEGGDGLRRTTTEVVVEVLRIVGRGDVAPVGADNSSDRDPAPAVVAEG